MALDEQVDSQGWVQGEKRTEAELLAALEAMAPPDAEGLLSELASALFPTGAGDLRQLTWPEPAPQPANKVLAWRSEREAKLRTAELRYRTLIEQIPAVTFLAVLGEGENEIYISPHIEALLGFTQKEWLANPFLCYTQLHPDDRDLWHREFARGCRTGGSFRAECRFLARYGSVVWVHGEAHLVRDDLRVPLFLQGVAYDISEAKRAEARVLREAVQTTEERYRDLVEQLGAVFWKSDVNTAGFTIVSQGAEQVLGFAPEAWLADPDFWLSRVHSEDRETAADAWRRARQLGHGTATFEFRALRADGRTVWLQQKVYAHPSQSGDTRLLGVILDVTDQKNAEE